MKPNLTLKDDLLPTKKELVFGWFRDGHYLHIGVSSAGLPGAFSYNLINMCVDSKDELHIWFTGSRPAALGVRDYLRKLHGLSPAANALRPRGGVKESTPTHSLKDLLKQN